MRSTATNHNLFPESPTEKYKKLVFSQLTKEPQLNGMTYESFYKKYHTLLKFSEQLKDGETIGKGPETYKGFTPLIIAADRNLEVLADNILNHEAFKNVDQKGQRGITALHCAARRGNLPLVKKLIEKGASIPLANDYEHNALHFAAMSGNGEVVDYVLQHCDPKLVYRKAQYTNLPLHLACKAGDAHSIELIGRKMKSNDLVETGVNSSTPLILASHAGCLEGVKFLLKYIPNKSDQLKQSDSFGQTVLRAAAFSGNVELCQTLEEAGATFDKYTEFNRSALRSAIESGNLAMVKYVFEHEPDAKYNLNRDINAGGLPLMHAVECDKFDIVKFFVEKGADVNLSRASDWDHETPLTISLYFPCKDMAKYLIDHGAKLPVNFKESMLKDVPVENEVEPDEDRHIDPDQNYNPAAGLCCVM